MSDSASAVPSQIPPECNQTIQPETQRFNPNRHASRTHEPCGAACVRHATIAPRHASSVKPSVCLAVSSPFTLNAFLGNHIESLRRHYRLTMVVNLEDEPIRAVVPADVILKSVRIAREIAPARDLVALWNLWRLLRRNAFSAVHSISPKAGLLTMIAGCLAGVPLRVHSFTGQVWATRRGASRALLKSLDWLLAVCATHVFADSASQRDFLVAEGVVPARKIAVLGAGSISGVDTARFRPDPQARVAVRAELAIEDGAPLLLYVGRMKREKGIADLLDAFRHLRQSMPAARLLLVGPDEDRLLQGSPAPGVHLLGYTSQVERYFAAADLLCLPSYREGFGSVIIEAAACGIPAVASRIYGLTDAVIEGVTGLLHPAGDVPALHQALLTLLQQPALRARMGQSARERALRDFEAVVITAAWLDFYQRHLPLAACAAE